MLQAPWLLAAAGSGVWAQQSLAHELGCSAACGVFPDPVSPALAAGSLLDHQGAPMAVSLNLRSKVEQSEGLSSLKGGRGLPVDVWAVRTTAYLACCRLLLRRSVFPVWLFQVSHCHTGLRTFLSLSCFRYNFPNVYQQKVLPAPSAIVLVPSAFQSLFRVQDGLSGSQVLLCRMTCGPQAFWQRSC